jgi:Ca2+:H+ antiporter
MSTRPRLRIKLLRINYLLILVPIAIGLAWAGASPVLVFGVAAVAIVPLSNIVGGSTETLARYIGPTLGGLLNASMGNAPELIIGLFALKNGLVSVVKSSMIGSVLGNLLLALGLAMFAGGLRHSTQRFNLESAKLATSMMFLAVAGLMIPAFFHFTSLAAEREISLEVAAILLVVYGLSLVFSLFTHRKLFEVKQPPELELPRARSWKSALGFLAGATVALAFTSEVLTDALDPATKQLGLNDTFAGVILLASIGNISSMLNAVVFAWKNQMDLAVSSLIGAATQVSLFVAPILVFLSLFLGQPMDLLFNRLELVALVVAVFINRNATIDGESNWLEGSMLIAVFTMLGIGFYFHN